MSKMKNDNVVLFYIFFCLFTITNWANADISKKPSAVEELRPGLLLGYLSRSDSPNSLFLIPSPPAAGSAAFALDKAISERAVALRDTPRWKLAASDADLSFPSAVDTFSCALNTQISEEKTPYLYLLLRRTLTDAGLSTYLAKNNYARKRPFMENNQPICTPESKEGLEKDGSYPSGHSAIGWAWALILTELAPDKTDAILARGRAFSESRNVCNVHWYSDVQEGRFMGASTVARLHANSEFLADLAIAKLELAKVRATDIKPTRDCEMEANTLNTFSIHEK